MDLVTTKTVRGAAVVATALMWLMVPAGVAEAQVVKAEVGVAGMF